ncbi:hypothetical protein SO694_00156022 [Aureococcus anophagefferens]|uniref:Uncharacterized protein n=1 Tax=Aureococcus anophagefferens TaxID=44056 RepID=A0ABR1G0R5_AURAN
MTGLCGAGLDLGAGAPRRVCGVVPRTPGAVLAPGAARDAAWVCATSARSRALAAEPRPGDARGAALAARGRVGAAARALAPAGPVDLRRRPAAAAEAHFAAVGLGRAQPPPPSAAFLQRGTRRARGQRRPWWNEAALGCLRSQRRALRDAAARGDGALLLLEDDAILGQRRRQAPGHSDIRGEIVDYAALLGGAPTGDT